MVVLVVDLADDLLQDVLHGDNAGRTPVLVDYHSQVPTVFAEIPKKVVKVTGLRNGQYVAHQLTERHPVSGPGGSGQQRLDVHHPNHMVQVAVEDRKA